MALAAGAAMPAAGAAASDDDAIIITGRGLAAAKGDKAFSVVTLDREDIEQAASGRLEDVLLRIADQQSFRRSDSRSSNATSQSITFRGMGGNASGRALLILDGVPQGDPFGGWISFPAFATDRIARIRVTRGGGSGLWGPGALAGTVEMESVGPDEVAPITGGLAVGSRQSIDARSLLIAGDRASFASIGGAYQRGDGFVPIVAGDRGPIDEPASYRQISVAARGVTAIGRHAEFQANISAFDDRRERGQPNTRNRGKGADASLRAVGRGPVGWSLLAYLQKRRFASQSAAINGDRTSSTLVNDQYSVPSTGLGGRAEVIPLTGDTEVRIGADLRRVEGRTNERYQYVDGNPTRARRAGGHSLTAGLFADATFERDALTITLAGRIDHWGIGHGWLRQETLAGIILTDLDLPDRRGWQPTGRLGLAFDVTPGLVLRGAAYRGWRLPTLNELYRPFRVGPDITAANAALKPETSVGVEAGLDIDVGPAWKVSATVFDARLDNAIANVTVAAGPGSFPEGFVPAGGSYRRRENLGHIRTRGLEVALDGRAGPFDFGLSYAFVDARVRADGLAPLDGLRPAQVPKHSLSATLGWKAPRGIETSATIRAVSRQFDDDLNQRILHGAVTVDGRASIPVAQGFAVELRGENLFDARVETARSGTDILERALPRTLWLGISMKR
jgi:outer membrane receptor protein involved in Fe transport